MEIYSAAAGQTTLRITSDNVTFTRPDAWETKHLERKPAVTALPSPVRSHHLRYMYAHLICP